MHALNFDHSSGNHLIDSLERVICLNCHKEFSGTSNYCPECRKEMDEMPEVGRCIGCNEPLNNANGTKCPSCRAEDGER